MALPSESMEANARPPIMPHPPAPLGFAWLWFIEQKKKGKRKEALSKGDREIARKPDSKGVVLAGKTSLSSAILAGDWVSSHDELGRNRPSDRSFAERLFGFSTPGLLIEAGSAKAEWDNRASPNLVYFKIRRQPNDVLA